MRCLTPLLKEGVLQCGRHNLINCTICAGVNHPLWSAPHRSLSDKEGNVVGGHVVGNLKVFTTCELVLLECAGLVFAREFDPRTGFKELVVAEAG